MKKITVLIGLFIFSSSFLIAGTSDPVAVLFKVKGHIEYSKNGTRWKRVRRNKFLFEGYQIRSDESGSGRITNRTSGKEFVLKPNSILKISAGDILMAKGELIDSQQSNVLLSSLMKRFTRSQSYTTVRRKANTSRLSLKLSRHIVVSETFPTIAFENLGNQLSYKVIIGEESYMVPAADGDIVTVKIAPFEGTLPVSILVFDNKGLQVAQLQPFRSRGVEKRHTVHWMTEDEQNTFHQTFQTISENYPDNLFMLGSFLEKEQMWIGAMSYYKQYLTENPEEIEMTPYLFRVYKKLKLNKTYKKELETWQIAMKE